VQDEAKILVSTSTTASDSEKRMSGTVFVLDRHGRKVAAPYKAFRVDLRECLNSDGLNLFRLTIDGEDIAFTEHVKDFQIATKDGARFVVDVKGSPSDGNDPFQDCKLYFDNLIDTTAQGKAIDIVVSDSMSSYSRKTGLAITRTS